MQKREKKIKEVKKRGRKEGRKMRADVVENDKRGKEGRKEIERQSGERRREGRKETVACEKRWEGRLKKASTERRQEVWKEGETKNEERKRKKNRKKILYCSSKYNYTFTSYNVISLLSINLSNH